MLEAAEIMKRFGPVTALSDVDMRVAAGEVVALVGENGSGKSTLARVIAGVHKPDGGQLRVDGESCDLASPADSLRRGIVLVAQELTAVPKMSVAENILLGSIPTTLRRAKRRRLYERARPLLDAVGVRCHPGTPFEQLRSGDRELVELAKALAAEPRLLILDEATSRLEENDVERLFGIVRRLREQGTATIIITHRLREIVAVADRAVVLRDGRNVGELPRAEITDERLSSMMVGRDLGDFYNKRHVAFGDNTLDVKDLLVAGASEPVSFQVRAGEVVGLAGLVGAGRTEVLETIAGVRRPLSGEVSVAGRPVAPGDPRAALRAGIALVPEDRRGQGLVLGRSLSENVTLGSRRSGKLVHKRQDRAQGEAAIKRLRIKARHPDDEVRTLSGGNQQKVVIARCLSFSPKLLLLDEPTRGIDVGAKQEIFRLMGEMLEAGLAIVIASSELTELLGTCDRILVMHDRALAGELGSEEASEERIALLSAGGRIHSGDDRTS